MLNEYLTYGLLCALAIALIFAAFTDLRSRKISNRLNLVIAIGAPLFWLASGKSLYPDIVLQLGLALGVFAVLAGLFAIGAMGGGDVKLLTALALWVDPGTFLKLVIIMALVGGLLTVVMGAIHVMRRRKDRLAIPYGVAIACGGLWVLGTEYLSQAPAMAGLG